MLNIESINHIGIRVKDKSIATSFYIKLGFQLVEDVGFDKGHPIIMRHPSGGDAECIRPCQYKTRKKYFNGC